MKIRKIMIKIMSDHFVNLKGDIDE